MLAYSLRQKIYENGGPRDFLSMGHYSATSAALYPHQAATLLCQEFLYSRQIYAAKYTWIPDWIGKYNCDDDSERYRYCWSDLVYLLSFRERLIINRRAMNL